MATVEQSENLTKVQVQEPESELERKAKAQDIDPESAKEAQSFWNQEGDRGLANYKAEISFMLNNSEVKAVDGQVFKLNKIKPRMKLELVQLEKHKPLDPDSPEYNEHLCKKACLLIQDMTPERFEESDVVLIEKLVLAWSSRPFNGFQPSINRT